ncbi:MAG: lipopolysaccharide transport periplasmic protein LptA [Campylobacteraceae bacterium]|jgi:lipopolysaccharide export system protein LptA|nr:lipopolysaccharide transport periplasmic protein LptA [Campylobacteraceae bacterium]
MRVAIALLLISTFTFAVEVQIVAKKVFADEKALKSRLSDNVVIKKGDDILVADTVTIDFNKDKEPLKYEAQGSVSANVTIDDKRYHASGSILTYDVAPNKYTLKGNAFLEELNTSRKVYGDIITIDQNNGTYAVDGGTEPVKFIFQIDDAKSKEANK